MEMSSEAKRMVDQVATKSQSDKERNKRIMEIVLIIATLLFGCLLGAFIALHSVNTAFDSAKLHICTSQEVNYSEQLYKLQSYVATNCYRNYVKETELNITLK